MQVVACGLETCVISREGVVIALIGLVRLGKCGPSRVMAGGIHEFTRKVTVPIVCPIFNCNPNKSRG